MRPRLAWEGYTLSLIFVPDCGLVGPGSEGAFKSALWVLEGVCFRSHLRPHSLGLLCSFDLCSEAAVLVTPVFSPGTAFCIGPRTVWRVFCCCTVSHLGLSGSYLSPCCLTLSQRLLFWGFLEGSAPNSHGSFCSSALIAKPQNRNGMADDGLSMVCYCVVDS